MKALIIKKILIFVILILTFGVTSANADIQVPLDYKFSGTPPSGSTPWLTATFTDISDNNVRLIMSASNLTGSEFISKWYFNLNPDLAGSLTFTPYDTSDVESVTPSYIINEYKADGDGWYDIRFEFPTADGSTDRFTSGDSIIYDISYSGTGAFDVSSFIFKSSPGGGNGVYESAAHIQGITGGTSGWIGNTTVVPEPISSTLFIVGGVALGFRSFRKMKKA